MTEDRIRVEGRAGAKPGQRVLRLVGPLNLVTVPEFLATVRNEIFPTLILEMSEVTMLDSAGVGSLIQILTSQQKAGHKMALAGLTERARSVLELTRVGRLFAIFPSAAEAEASF